MTEFHWYRDHILRTIALQFQKMIILCSSIRNMKKIKLNILKHTHTHTQWGQVLNIVARVTQLNVVKKKNDFIHQFCLRDQQYFVLSITSQWFYTCILKLPWEVVNDICKSTAFNPDQRTCFNLSILQVRKSLKIISTP